LRREAFVEEDEILWHVLHALACTEKAANSELQYRTSPVTLLTDWMSVLAPFLILILLRSNSICQEGAFDPTEIFLHRMAFFILTNEFVVVFLNPQKVPQWQDTFNRFRQLLAITNQHDVKTSHAISDAALQFGL
jgi:hypothetical protein